MKEKHTPGPWIGDEVLDANGFHTIRQSDGSKNGNVHSEVIATVYQKGDAELIARTPDLLKENETLKAQRDKLLEALQNILFNLDGMGIKVANRLQADQAIRNVKP